MRAAEALNGGVRFPAGFEQIVDAQPGIPCRKFGMIAAAGAAGVREDQDALAVIHERLGFGEICGGRAVFDDETILPADDAPRTAGDLRHQLGAEMLDDLVERAGHGRKRSKLRDQFVAARDSFAAFDGLAVAIDRPGRQIALAVGERLVELHREGMGEVIEDVFPRRDVDADIVPFLGRDLGEAALHQRLAG